MMYNDSKTKEDFNYLSKNQARQIIRKFIQNNQMIESLIESVDNEGITGHILKDILCTNSSFESIQSCLKNKANEMKLNGLSVGNTILL
jgi:predicted transcriptional regulator